jgi:hypothetical protein
MSILPAPSIQLGGFSITEFALKSSDASIDVPTLESQSGIFTALETLPDSLLTLLFRHI